MILNKKSPEKSPFTVRLMETNDVYNHGKKGLDIKNTRGYIQYADA